MYILILNINYALTFIPVFSILISHSLSYSHILYLIPIFYILFPRSIIYHQFCRVTDIADRVGYLINMHSSELIQDEDKRLMACVDYFFIQVIFYIF